MQKSIKSAYKKAFLLEKNIDYHFTMTYFAVGWGKTFVAIFKIPSSSKNNLAFLTFQNTSNCTQI